MVCVLRVTLGSAQISMRVRSGPMPASDSATATFTLAGKPRMALARVAFEDPQRLFQRLQRDALAAEIGRALKAFRRLARANADALDLAFGNGADGVEPRQGTGRHDDAGAGDPGAFHQVHVVEKLADG